MLPPPCMQSGHQKHNPALLLQRNLVSPCAGPPGKIIQRTEGVGPRLLEMLRFGLHKVNVDTAPRGFTKQAGYETATPGESREQARGGQFLGKQSPRQGGSAHQGP